MNLVKLSKYFIFISFLIIATSCETTDVEEKVIKPEPVPKIIYTPEVEETVEKTVEENDEIVEYFKGVELFLNKSLNDLILKYGKVDFSKIESVYEFHRYNSDNCRVFIQNRSIDKTIINITIYNYKKNLFIETYSKDLCTDI